MRVVYLAHRIRDPRGIYYHQQNIERAAAIALRLWQMGFAAICPGLNTLNFDGSAPDDVWLKGDIAIMRRCDAVVMAPGWQTSVGAKGEREHALKCGIPVFDWSTQKVEIEAFAKQEVSA